MNSAKWALLGTDTTTNAQIFRDEGDLWRGINLDTEFSCKETKKAESVREIFSGLDKRYACPADSPNFTFYTVDVKGLLCRPINARQAKLEIKRGFEYGELTHANNGARLFTKWVEIEIFDCTISVAVMLRSPFPCFSSSLNSPFLSTLFWFTLVRTDNGDTC
jgi:hypothetical protein